MSDCDSHKNIKKPEPTIDNVKKSIEDGLLITIVVCRTVGIFYVLMTTDAGQHNALLTSTLLACFMFLPIWEK